MKRKKRHRSAYLYLTAVLLLAVIAVLILVTEKERRIARELASPPHQEVPAEKGAPRPRDTAPMKGEKPDTEEAVRGFVPTEGRGAPGKDFPAAGTNDPKRSEKTRYKIAVIIDDVGYPHDDLEAYAGFRGKLTFSILPHLPSSSRFAELLHARGFEVMIHIPMEPDGYPLVNPGPEALLRSDTPGAVRDKIARMIGDVPFAVGANNHMGSRATRECELMEWTMGELKSHGLFFIDSLTTADSCARDFAAKNRVRASRRDVFLDNTDSYPAIEAQFEQLKRIAKSRGAAIGIGHIRRVHTLGVLQAQLPRLEKEGFSLVFASEAVGDGALPR